MQLFSCRGRHMAGGVRGYAQIEENMLRPLNIGAYYLGMLPEAISQGLFYSLVLILAQYSEYAHYALHILISANRFITFTSSGRQKVSLEKALRRSNVLRGDGGAQHVFC